MSELSLFEFMNDVFKQCNAATLQHVSQTIALIHQADESMITKQVTISGSLLPSYFPSFHSFIVLYQRTEEEMESIKAMSVACKTSYAADLDCNNMSSKDIDDITRMYTTNWYDHPAPSLPPFLPRCISPRPFELSNLIKYQLALVPVESTSVVKVYLVNQLLEVLSGAARLLPL